MISISVARQAFFRNGKIAQFALVCAALTAAPYRAAAEPVLDRALQGLQFVPRRGCDILNVQFGFRIAYVSHFPSAQASELRIRVRPLDPAVAGAQIQTRRESLRPPVSPRVPIRAIEFSAAEAGGPQLILQFAAPLNFKVGQGADYESLTIAFHSSGTGADCKPELPPTASGGPWNTTVSRHAWDSERLPSAAATPMLPKRKQRPTRALTEAEKRDAGAAMDEGRAALRKHDYATAAAKFAKVLTYPESDYSPEAQELLALALQRSGQRAEARGEYEDYLSRYPSGEGAERVRQRLDALITAELPPTERLRRSREQYGAEGGPHAPVPTTWTVSGSVGQFYIRDDSFRTLRDPTIAPNPNDTADDHRTHQNELLTSLDFIATLNSDGVKTKLRFSGTEEHRFKDDSEVLGVAALFIDTAVKDWGTDLRIGRQTRNSGGVLGRFDGVYANWQAAPYLRLNAVAGSPVANRRDEPFVDDRYFYGGSVDIGPFWDGFDTTFYYFEQRDRSFLDRRAVGVETRYFDASKSAFATVDYDVNFDQLNAGIVNGTWTLPDKSTIHAGFDYRKSPFLTAWNAIQGQPYTTLYAMLKARTAAEVNQLAVDRTATWISESVGFTYALSEKWQASFDFTAVDVSGTIASGGVDATLPSGQQYYYSTQLIGTNALADGDFYIAGFRVADLPETTSYVLDLSVRYPFFEATKFTPRLQVGYTEGKTSDLIEKFVLPSILLDYYLTKDFSFEVEAGTKLMERKSGPSKENETEFFFTVGYRYDFYKDGTLPGSPLTAGPTPK